MVKDLRGKKKSLKKHKTNPKTTGGVQGTHTHQNNHKTGVLTAAISVDFFVNIFFFLKYWSNGNGKSSDCAIKNNTLEYNFV